MDMRATVIGPAKKVKISTTTRLLKKATQNMHGIDPIKATCTIILRPYRSANLGTTHTAKNAPIEK